MIGTEVMGFYRDWAFQPAHSDASVLLPEIMEWLDENVKSHWDWTHHPLKFDEEFQWVVKLFFDDPNEALLFKVTWI